jgi:hypothetical protein
MLYNTWAFLWYGKRLYSSAKQLLHYQHGPAGGGRASTWGGWLLLQLMLPSVYCQDLCVIHAAIKANSTHAFLAVLHTQHKKAACRLG